MKSLSVAEARQELLRVYQAALPMLAERRNRGGDGLTRLQMHVLHVLEREGPLSMRQVAALLGVTPTSVTEIGDALVRRELVARREDPSDRRVRLLYVTDAGHEALTRTRQGIASELDRALGTLDGAERADFVALVSKILASVSQEDQRSS